MNTHTNTYYYRDYNAVNGFSVSWHKKAETQQKAAKRYSREREGVALLRDESNGLTHIAVDGVLYEVRAVREVGETKVSPAACENCGEVGWPCCGADGAVREVE